jgi:hypothetical protein
MDQEKFEEFLLAGNCSQEELAIFRYKKIMG